MIPENTGPIFRKAAELIASSGPLPLGVSDTLIAIVQYYLDEDDAKFIAQTFDERRSLSLDQVKAKTGLTENEIAAVTERIARKGLLFNQPNSKGLMVYRLLPLVIVGAFEYTFMKEEIRDPGDYKYIAGLYRTLLDELKNNIQNGYDVLLPIFEQQPPIDRTIPTYNTDQGRTIKIAVNQSVEGQEAVLPAQTVEKVIAKFDDIAVGHCFCRNYNRVLGHGCELNAPSEVCFSFGKSAKYTIDQGFARPVSKKEALNIMKQAEAAGLIHKAFHNGSDIGKVENSICNCCKDCCDTFALWRNGATPLINSTNYLSIIDQDACTGCGECVHRCPVNCIALDDDGKAARKKEYCIGCGVCARFCPETAIFLAQGMRTVYVPPPRLRS